MIGVSTVQYELQFMSARRNTSKTLGAKTLTSQQVRILPRSTLLVTTETMDAILM